jgi:D-alanyl-D-alanine carboxypeptidase
VKVKMAPTQVATLASPPAAPASGPIVVPDAPQDRGLPAIAAPPSATAPQAKADPKPAPQPAPAQKSAAPSQNAGMPGATPSHVAAHETAQVVSHAVSQGVSHEALPLAPEPKRQPVRDLIGEAIRESAPPQGAPRQAAPPAAALHSGWVIQVGAFDVEREAREKLNAVQAKAAQILGRASPFTEAVAKGDKTLYRARFAGMQKDQAEAICRQLKRNDIACMIIKN